MEGRGWKKGNGQGRKLKRKVGRGGKDKEIEKEVIETKGRNGTEMEGEMEQDRARSAELRWKKEKQRSIREEDNSDESRK